MGKMIGGGGLLFLSLFMFLGFLRADISGGFLVSIMAFFIAVGLPALGGSALLYSHYRQGKAFQSRKEQLRIQTLETEILRLAGEKGRKLSEIEIVSETSFDPETVKTALESLVRKGSADIGVSDEGSIFYTFPTVQTLDDRSEVKGILDD